MNKKTVKIPAGEYYLGDPCYPILDNEWSDIVKKMYDDAANFLDGDILHVSNGIMLQFLVKDFKCTYNDQYDFEYSSDSGIIGLVSLSHNPNYTLTDLVNVIKFDTETECTSEDGVLTFGNYIIDTNNKNIDNELDFEFGYDY